MSFFRLLNLYIIYTFLIFLNVFNALVVSLEDVDEFGRTLDDTRAGSSSPRNDEVRRKWREKMKQKEQDEIDKKKQRREKERWLEKACGIFCIYHFL